MIDCYRFTGCKVDGPHNRQYHQGGEKRNCHGQSCFFQGGIPPAGHHQEWQFWRGFVLENVPIAEHIAE